MRSSRPLRAALRSSFSPLAFERETRADLRRRRWLRVHVFLIGALTLLACMAVSQVLLSVGVTHLQTLPQALRLLF